MKKQPKIRVHSTKTEMLPLAGLIPYKNNARIHSPEQIVALAEIIRVQGFTSPLLIDDKDVLISGHGRLLAAESLGMKDVPCIRVTGISAAEIKAMRLADNQIASKSTWDLEILRAEMEELDSPTLELEGLGFALELDVPETPDLEARGTGTRLSQSVIAFNIVFDDVEQQAFFHKFIRYLKSKDPKAKLSQAARLVQYLRDKGDVKE